MARGYETQADARSDLIQDIHVALWGSLASFDGRCSLRTWVYRIAHNTAADHIRRRRRWRRESGATLESLEAVADADDPATSTMGLIDFYRAQVAREAPDLRLIGAILLPLVIGMGVVFAGLWPKIVAERMSGLKTFLNFLPILLLLGVWVPFFAVRLRRGRRSVAERLREIDAMRGL